MCLPVSVLTGVVSLRKLAQETRAVVVTFSSVALIITSHTTTSAHASTDVISIQQRFQHFQHPGVTLFNAFADWRGWRAVAPVGYLTHHLWQLRSCDHPSAGGWQAGAPLC